MKKAYEGRKRMGYFFVTNCFAPKWYFESERPSNLHCVSYEFCNFKCNFCKVAYRNIENKYFKINSFDKIQKILTELLKHGNGFKFTGGEPTLAPFLYESLKFLKERGAQIYLDTNGSNYKIIQSLISDSLIDVLGISLKGTTKMEAMEKSGVDGELCWDNVFKTIQIAKDLGIKQIIVTYVCFSDFNIDKVFEIADMFSKYSNVCLKFNNYSKTIGAPDNFKPMDTIQLYSLLEYFVHIRPEWKSRIIIIDDPKAVHDYEKIKFL